MTQCQSLSVTGFDDGSLCHDSCFRTAGSASGPGPLRPLFRARRVRCRLRRDAERRTEPFDRRPGPGGAAQSRPPRRHRLRPEDRGRCRHPAADPRRLPARERRLPPAPAGRVRGRQRLPADRAGRGGQGQGDHRADRRGGAPDRARLAPGADRRLVAERPDPLEHALLRAAVRGGRRAPGDGHRARSADVLPPSPDPARDRCLLRVAVGPDPGLQGHADHRAARAGLPRAAGRADGQRHGRRALAVLHQHVPGLGARAPVPDDRAQRRDQHRQGQQELDAGPGGAAGPAT